MQPVIKSLQLPMDDLNIGLNLLFQYEGTPFYPQNDRFWTIVEKYKVNQFYTAPTAIRALMKFEDNLVLRYKRSTSLIITTKVLGFSFFPSGMTCLRLKFSVLWGNPSILKHGCGTTRLSEERNAPLQTPSGRQKLAVTFSLLYPEPHP